MDLIIELISISHSKVGFRLGLKTKNTMKLSSAIGREYNFGPKEFTLAYMFKVQENDVALMGSSTSK